MPRELIDKWWRKILLNSNKIFPKYLKQYIVAYMIYILSDYRQGLAERNKSIDMIILTETPIEFLK